MKLLPALCAILAATTLLAGCGNKGALTLPPPAKLADHTSAAPQ